MKIQISRAGALRIDRKWKECPYTVKLFPDSISGIDTWDGRACGDWCALFGEPTQVRSKATNDPSNFTFISLCKGYWKCEDENFTDERKEEMTNEDS